MSVLITCVVFPGGTPNAPAGPAPSVRLMPDVVVAGRMPDSISLHAGDVRILREIGPRWEVAGIPWTPTLLYGSGIWSLIRDRETGRLAASLERVGPYGLGWRLPMGRIFQACAWGCGGLEGFFYEDWKGVLHPIQFGASNPHQDRLTGVVTDGTSLLVEAVLQRDSAKSPPEIEAFRAFDRTTGLHMFFGRRFGPYQPRFGNPDWMGGWMLTHAEVSAAGSGGRVSWLDAEYRDTSFGPRLEEVRASEGPSGKPTLRMTVRDTSDLTGVRIASLAAPAHRTAGITVEIGEAGRTRRHEYQLRFEQLAGVEVNAAGGTAWYPAQWTLTLLAAVEDGSSHRFLYDLKTGELTTMILPKVAVSYEYETNVSRSGRYDWIGREVRVRRLTCHGNTASWSFWRVRAAPESPVGGFTIVTDPEGNQTKYSFYCPFDFPRADGLLRTKERFAGAPFDMTGTVVSGGVLLSRTDYLLTMQRSCFGDLVLHTEGILTYRADPNSRTVLIVEPARPHRKPTTQDVAILGAPQVKRVVLELRRIQLETSRTNEAFEAASVIVEPTSGDYHAQEIVRGRQPLIIDLDLPPDAVAVIHTHPTDRNDQPHSMRFGGRTLAREPSRDDQRVCAERKVICYVVGRNHIARYNYRIDREPVTILEWRLMDEYLKPDPRKCPLSSTIEVTSTRARRETRPIEPPPNPHMEVLEERFD